MAFHQLWENRFELSPGKWVFVPSIESRERGEFISDEIKKKWRVPEYFFHFHNGGHVNAIKVHASNRYFCSIDIQDFFSSINLSRVTRALKKYFNYALAREFARDSVVKLINNQRSQFILPFGFVQSPILATLCLDQSALGNVLKKLSEDTSFRVSVYVDDIIFSGNDLNQLQKIFEDMIGATKKSGWSVNQRKTIHPNHEIVVFNINLTHKKTSITKERMALFSDAYHAGNDFQKKGILTYIESINPAQIDLL